ncbi:MAG: glycosyltransferase family 2 protein, partial [Coprococcus comes]|nr:glycosyltransferase family 2 protein [Coprococcus comes]
MKIDVIIPVYRPTEKLHKVLYRLCRQTYLPEQIILLHTRDGIKLDVSVCKDRVSVTEIPIPEKEFDHERTRDLGIRMSDADIVVMMTQ